MPGQVQGLANMPPPSPVGPRGSSPATASPGGAGSAGTPTVGGGGGPGPGPSGGVTQSPLGGSSSAPPSTPNRKVLQIIDPSTGKPIELPDSGGSSGSGGGNSAVRVGVQPVSGRSPRTSVGGSFSDFAKEMREKAQAALKSDTPTMAATAIAGSGMTSSSPSKKPAVVPGLKGDVTATAPSPAPALRGGPAKIDDAGPPVEVSFGSYGGSTSNPLVDEKKSSEEAAKAAEEAAAAAKAEAAAKAKAAAKIAEEAKRAEEAAAAKARKAAEEEEVRLHEKSKPLLSSNLI